MTAAESSRAPTAAAPVPPAGRTGVLAGPPDGSAPDGSAPDGGSGAVAGSEDDLVARINAMRGEIERRMGIVFLEASAERVVATMPVEGNRQPYGILHGGASVVLAETVGSIAAGLSAGPDGVPLGIEISASHHRSVASGVVTATATMIRAGRTLAAYDIRIVDEAGRAVCTSRLTCMLRHEPPPGGHFPRP